jgi:hypothetical protein
VVLIMIGMSRLPRGALSWAAACSSWRSPCDAFLSSVKSYVFRAAPMNAHPVHAAHRGAVVGLERALEQGMARSRWPAAW